MSLWIERINELSHYYALRYEAEMYRLIHLKQAVVPNRLTVFDRAMCRLGSALSAWGSILQQRFGSRSAANIPIGKHQD